MKLIEIGSIRAEGKAPRYYVAEDGRIVAYLPSWDTAATHACELCASLGFVAYRGVR
ncbi:hypothetical protein ABIE28_000700 [Devosia sp. 2618]